jgi:hemerythrin-like domain-containing protein
MARNILTTLKAEHDALRALFKKMEDTTDRAEKGRMELLEQIEQQLIPHAKWEENVFYPAFAERADRDGQKTHAEARLEHSAVENTVLPAVKEADPATPEFAGRAKVFGELIDHHAKEEENTMFKMARELFSAEELAQFDEDYETWKESPAATAAMMQAKTKAGVKAAAGKMFGH